MKNQSTEKSTAPSPLTVMDLNDDQFAEWEQRRKDWLKSSFRPLLTRYGLQQDCVSCGDVFLRSRVTIDPEGNIAEIEVDEAVIDCGALSDEDRNKLHGDLLAEFRLLEFGEALRDLVLRVRIGRPSKC
ncbi:MAG: hypothetical protein AAGN35_18940 [Bacteroidota bacterium]